MSPVAIGIVGYGKIAREQHEPALAASEAFELTAIVDPAERHATLPSFLELDAMLAARPEIAAVALCMPPRFRAGAAREALSAGRHVLLEKPPCATMAQAAELREQAADAGLTLFAAWHSREAAGVAAARDWLSTADIRSVEIAWKEDVRVWHPGQAWIWQEGGFGVFDPGINSLSILAAILPRPFHVTHAELGVPENCAAPIVARLALRGEGGVPVTAEFDFRQTGPQSWDIAVETAEGRLLLSHGGNRLRIAGEEIPLAPEREYPALYERFAELIRRGESDVDLAPLALVEQAMSTGRRTRLQAFEEAA